MCPEQKRRRGRLNLKTLVETFIIPSFVRNLLLIFLSAIGIKSALYVFDI